MTRIPGRARLLDAAQRAIWAILPEKLDAVLALLERRARGDTPSKAELEAMGYVAARPQAALYDANGVANAQQVAIIPLNGVVAHHAGWEIRASGGTSTDEFRAQINAAVGNTNVGTIVIRCDSPGGAIEGAHEAFSAVLAARAKKRVIAVADAHMHSAAYWICAGASEIVVTPSGFVGDIGVMTVHTSYAQAEAKAGIERTLIKAGAHKGEGFSSAPLSDADRAAIQERIDAIYDMFVGDVAAGREDSVAAVRDGYGEGRSVDAKTAKAIGLVDRIATYEQVLAELGVQQAPSATRAERTTPRLAADATPDSGVEECPDCGAPMEMQDGEMVCPDCDTPEMVGALTEIPAVAALSALPAVTASAATVSTMRVASVDPAGQSESQTTHQESGMTEEERQAALKALRDAEKQRTAAIRSLCADHEISAAKADEFVNSEMTLDDVRASILDSKKKQMAARPTVNVSGVAHRSESDKKMRGFRSPAEMMLAVMQSSRARAVDDIKDERLRSLAVHDEDSGDVSFALPNAMAPARYRAAVGSDEQGEYDFQYGGALVTPSVYPGLLQTAVEDDPTVGRTTAIPMATPNIKIRARTDKDHTSSVSGGLTVTRRPETVAPAAQRMKFERVTLDATTLMGLAYETEELLRDSPISFAAIIDAGFRDQFASHLFNEKLNGAGMSEFLGILNANNPSLITVTKESGQAADTLLYANVLKMRSRCWGFGQAIWIANHDTYPQLAQMTVNVKNAAGSDNVGGSAVYQTSAIEGRPDMLLGRPIFYSEYAETIGDKGDIILANWSQYLEGTYQPIESASSVHARFENHEQAFKVWLRNAAAPWWRAALTPKKGANTLSPFVVLEAR